MKRIFPDVVVQSNPIGFEQVCVYHQMLFSNLIWNDHKSFGRAYEQTDSNGSRHVPKIYQGKRDYYDPLPHDALSSYSFLMGRGPEREVDEACLERDMSAIFWFDLSRVKPSVDDVSIESLRFEVQSLLEQSEYYQGITAFYDERVEDIFLGYITDELLADNKYLMFPYAGFRFDFLVGYPKPCGEELDNLIAITRANVPLDWILLKIDDRVAKLHLAYDGPNLTTALTEI
jgi:hypothetical protein